MAEDWSDADRMFMEHALLVAERGRGKVSPNPLVGCVLVKDGEVIAEGWHDHLGGLHAEQMAIHDAEKKGIHQRVHRLCHVGTVQSLRSNTTMHRSLMWAGVSKVIIAHHDPNPTVRGDGCRVLEAAGIPTQTGLMEEEAHDQMRAFMHWCTHRRPLVTVKLALDAQGSVDDRSAEAQRFTSAGCLEKVHELRRDCDAVLVGVETVNRDDPQLNVRLVPSTRQPLRVVIDPNQRIDAKAQLLADEGETLLMQNNFTGLNSLLHQLADREIQRARRGWTDHRAPIFGGRSRGRGVLDHSEVVHQEPVEAGLDAELLAKSGLTLAQEYAWGEERVEHYLRTPTSA